jgi:hypothetical protein
MEENMAKPIRLSKAARDLLRCRANREHVEVTPENLDAYRELARAGAMYPCASFTRGPESVFRFTEEGWNLRHELQRSRFVPLAMLRRILRAFSSMGSSVSGAR